MLDSFKLAKQFKMWLELERDNFILDHPEYYSRMGEYDVKIIINLKTDKNYEFQKKKKKK